MSVKKMGRPTQSPKTNQLRIRMSDEDMNILNICSEKTGMNKADVVREGIKKVYQDIKK